MDYEKECARDSAINIFKVEEIGFWNSYTPSMYNLRRNRTSWLNESSTGGTDPKTITQAPNFNDVRNGFLWFSTDGEIGNNRVPGFENALPQIKISICIYTGTRNNSPSELNLPVFAPLMNKSKLCIMIHWNGDTYKLILVNKPDALDCSELQEYMVQLPNAEDLNESIGWDRFPDIQLECLRNISVKSIHYDLSLIHI